MSIDSPVRPSMAIAGCLVWIIVVLIFLIWVVISTVCLFKGGSIFGVEIDSDGIMDYAAAHTSKVGWWWWWWWWWWWRR